MVSTFYNIFHQRSPQAPLYWITNPGSGHLIHSLIPCPHYLKFISFQYCQESAKRQRISANLNIILYIGLGTMAIGLIITFVGIGEKGFKTIQLRKHFKHTQTQINQLLNIRRGGSHFYAFHGQEFKKLWWMNLLKC